MSSAEHSVPGEDAGRAAWVRRWKTLGPVLERIQMAELRAMDAPAAQRVVESLLDLAAGFPPRPPTSGLIEYQRRLRKGRS